MSDVVFETRERVGWITLSRPAKANALTVPMQDAIIGYLAAAADDDAIAAVVVTGLGARVFSGGADFTQVLDGSEEEQAERRSRALFDTLRAVMDCPKPVVAAVNGPAIGSGFLIACVADARIATPEASFALPEIVRGQPTFAGIVVASRIMGDAAAADLVLGGRAMDAREAAARHLTAATVPLAELADAAQAHALRLAGFSPLAYRLAKEAVHREMRAGLARSAAESAAVRPLLRAARDTVSRGTR